MTKPSGIDLTKQSSVALGQPQFEEQVKERQDWHEGINKICSRLSLSTDAFNAKGTYELIEEYYEPEFSYKSIGDFKNSIHKARRVINEWN